VLVVVVVVVMIDGGHHMYGHDGVLLRVGRQLLLLLLHVGTRVGRILLLRGLELLLVGLLLVDAPRGVGCTSRSVHLCREDTPSKKREMSLKMMCFFFVLWKEPNVEPVRGTGAPSPL